MAPGCLLSPAAPRPASPGAHPGPLAAPPGRLPGPCPPAISSRPGGSFQSANGRRPEPPDPGAGAMPGPSPECSRWARPFLPCPGAGPRGGLSAHCLCWWPRGHDKGPAPGGHGASPRVHPWKPPLHQYGHLRVYAHVFHAQAACGHPCACSVNTEGTRALGDGRPGFEPRPNPQELVDLRELTRPLSSVPPWANGDGVRLPSSWHFRGALDELSMC